MVIKSTRNTVAAAVVFSVLSGFSGIGNANLQAIDVESVNVPYSDLDLQDKHGQHVLYMRLRGAADAVCGEVMSKSAAEVRQKRECFENALDRAIREVGSEALISLHQG